MSYIGRFAPSPTGKLHQGSLVSAVGSYLYAKVNEGQWLVRMEDLDPLREEKGAAKHILQTLEKHHLYWDQEVLYQSQRQQAYQDVIDYWFENNLVYRCRCTRKGLIRTAKKGEYGIIYPNHCRDKAYDASQRYSIRLKTTTNSIQFNDVLLGAYKQQLYSEMGDFIVKRSDGFFSYQLAVVVDDDFQGVTDIVRGKDLLWNTPRQLYIQQLLGFNTPNYYHLPLVVDSHGNKLSKQTFAPVLDNNRVTVNLFSALTFLGFNTDAFSPDDRSASEWLKWAENQMRLGLLEAI